MELACGPNVAPRALPFGWRSMSLSTLMLISRFGVRMWQTRQCKKEDGDVFCGTGAGG